MELLLQRFEFDSTSTVGRLYQSGNELCYILEDKDRGLNQGMDSETIRRRKVDGKTAIPYGRYEINVTYSPRFKRPLPQLLAVKGFSGIRIHPGNDSGDTEGCLLPGSTYRNITTQGCIVENSRLAFNKLYDIIGKALLNEKVYITIEKYTQSFHV